MQKLCSFLFLLLGGIATLVGVFFTLAYFVAPCLYSPFFYADYNKARESLLSIPDVEIVDDWQHHDITLEDCGFTVRVRDSEAVRVDFHEGENWEERFRRLDGVIVTLPYNPTTNSYEKTYLGANDLEDAGINLVSLSDVLQNIDEVLRLARAGRSTTGERELTGEWCYIVYDLNRYKNNGQQGSMLNH